MERKPRIILSVFLMVLVLLSLPILYVSLKGIVVGSFEWFPEPEDVEVKRMIWIIITVPIISFDIFAGIRIWKLLKDITSE